jgi:hypothetical protein
MKRLHTVAFEIRNIKRRKVNMDIQRAKEVMEKGPPSLRRLCVNGVKWEVMVLPIFL